MNSSRRRTLIVLAVAALVGVAAGITIGLIEDDDPDPGAGSAPAAPAPTAGPGTTTATASRNCRPRRTIP